MKILNSPAKSLDFESIIENTEHSKPVFLNKTSEINKVLRKRVLMI